MRAMVIAICNVISELTPDETDRRDGGGSASTYGIRDVAQTHAFEMPRQTPIVPEGAG